MRQSNARVAVDPFGLRMEPDGRRQLAALRRRPWATLLGRVQREREAAARPSGRIRCLVALGGRETMTNGRLPRRPVCVVSFAVALALVVVAGFLGRPTPASASYWRSCSPPMGTGYASASLRAHDVHCGKARRRVKGFLRKAQEQGPDVVVRGFHCVAIRAGVACRRGSQRIHFHGNTE